jgi:hypothetical protein
MRRPTRCIASLILLALAGWPAAAEPPMQSALVASADPAVPGPDQGARLPDFRMPRGDYRQPPGPIRNGLIGAVPVGRNAHVALGRFAVPNFNAPRIEPGEIRRRDRSLAAIGFSLRF